MVNSKAQRRSVVSLFVLMIVVLFLFASVNIYKTSGSSMEPTISSGELVLVESLSYGMQLGKRNIIRWGSPKRLTIVQYQSEGLVIKRCVGVPGDKIELVDNSLTIQGETYQVTRSVAQDLKQLTTIPEGYYFFVGDNRSQSTDSRHYGLVPIENIRGRVRTLRN